MGRYGLWMIEISFKRHRFSPEIIQHAGWLYAGSPCRFVMSRICWLNVASMYLTKRYGAGS